MEENLCRICLQTNNEEEMKSIFDKDENTIISNKIKSCCGIKIIKNADGFPTKICSKCNVFLSIAYKLRTICQNSDAYLRRFVVKDFEVEETEEIPIKPEKDDPWENNEESNENDDNISVKSNNSLLTPILDPEVSNCKTEFQTNQLDECGDIEKNPETILEQNDEKNESERHNYACNQCDRTYARKKNLDKHVKAHKDLEEGIRKPPEKFGICPHCGENFPQKSLPVHIRRHTGEKPFGCDQCEMRYVRRQDLIVHKRCHTGEKPHICLTCGKAFSRANQLVRHIRVHTGERPYKCNRCDRGFAQRNDLNLHIRRHTGEKPYECGICGESFINGTTLKNHRKIADHYEEERRDRFEKIRVTNPRRTYRATPLPKQPQVPVLVLEQVEEEL